MRTVGAMLLHALFPCCSGDECRAADLPLTDSSGNHQECSPERIAWADDEPVGRADSSALRVEREGNDEHRTFPGCASGRDLALVALDDSPANGQAHPRAGIRLVLVKPL
jgi:hypothetical protein